MQAVQQLPTQQIPMDNSAEAVKPSSPKVIWALTGLRFFPLMALVWHHVQERFTFMHGFISDVDFDQGVAFFFVLSGFMLGYRYRNVKDLGTTLHFFLARTARLWPLHLMCITFLLVLIPEVFKIRGDQLNIFFCNLFLLHAWVPIYSYFFSFNGPSWSSSTLTFFDFAFPLVLLTAKRSWALALAATAGLVLIMISICNLAHLPESAPTTPCIHGMIYINPLTRLFEFTSGVVAALAFQKYSSKYKLGTVATTAIEVTILSLIMYIVFNSHHWIPLTTPWATEAGAWWIHITGTIFIPCALLIMVLGTERGLVARFLATKWMCVLGDMSFCLYMLHGVFIAYFTVHFHDETSPTNAFFFFASLMIGSHLMHNFLVQPTRELLVKHGTTLLARKWPAPPRKGSSKKPKSKLKSGLMLASEIAVFATVLYLAMPTIDRITPAEADAIAAKSETRDIEFAPWLKCKTVSATASANNQVHVNTVWQTLSAQSVDYHVQMLVHDKSGAVLGFANYSLDGRHQNVPDGTLWSDKVAINVSSAEAKEVSIKLTRGKKRRLVQPGASAITSPTGDTLVVPVQQAISHVNGTDKISLVK